MVIGMPHRQIARSIRSKQKRVTEAKDIMRTRAQTQNQPTPDPVFAGYIKPNPLLKRKEGGNEKKKKIVVKDEE